MNVLKWAFEKRVMSDWQFQAYPITDLSRTETTPLHIYIVHCRPKSSNKTSEGIGVGTVREHAITKAICESIERQAVHYGHYNSNGLAIHTSVRRAVQKARFELVERHLLLAHYWGQVPFFTCPQRDLKPSWFGEVAEYLKNFGYQLRVSEMQRLGGLRSFVSLVTAPQKKNKFGLIIGLGAHLDPLTAINQAVGESFQGWLGYKRVCTPISFREFSKIKNYSVIDHLRLSIHPEYYEKTGCIFEAQRPSRQNADRPFRWSRLSVSAIHLPAPKSRSFPFRVYRADSDKMIGLNFGLQSPSQMSRVRQQLEDFWGQDYSAKELPEYPHPIY